MIAGKVGDLSVKDKIVLITGAGSGINYELAKLAYTTGAKVIIGDLKLTQPAAQLVSDSNGDVIYEETNVADWTALKKLITVAEKRFGSVPDIYVAGAGVFEPPWSNFWDDTETERYAELDINVGHVIKLTRLGMRALVGSGKKGVIISIASQAGLEGSYSIPLYCATKHAVIGFTKSMGLADVYEGVKIVSICPGMVDTPLFTPDKAKMFHLDVLPKLSPAEVAQLMLQMVQESKYPGGTIVSMFPTDQGPKVTVEHEEKPVDADVAVPDHLSKIRQTMEHERKQ